MLRPLAAALGLSPTPVREALLRLISEQALELDDRNTACVPVTAREVFLEIHGVRGDLEERITRELATHVTADEIAVMRAKHHDFILAYEAGSHMRRRWPMWFFTARRHGFRGVCLRSG